MKAAPACLRAERQALAPSGRRRRVGCSLLAATAVSQSHTLTRLFGGGTEGSDGTVLRWDATARASNSPEFRLKIVQRSDYAE